MTTRVLEPSALCITFRIKINRGADLRLPYGKKRETGMNNRLCTNALLTWLFGSAFSLA